MTSGRSLWVIAEQEVEALDLMFDTDRPEAIRANELARQLVTARVQVRSGSNPGDAYDLSLFARILVDAINETTRQEEPIEFLAYLLAALALVGAAGVWMGAEISQSVSDLGPDEASAKILSDMMGALAAPDAPKL